MPLKALSKNEDLAAIPLDEPVLVELEPGTTDETTVDEPERKPDPPARKKEGSEDGASVLQTQMEEMRRANAKLARERDDARREADEARGRAADTEADLIQNGLTAAQSEVKSARAALKAAVESGDTDAQADAQERIARAAADVRDFERAAAVQAEEKERAKTAAPRTPSNPTVEERVDAIPDLTESERRWLKAHPDAITDQQRNNELGVAYHRATKAGHARGTEGYFSFIEEFMGYSKPERTADDRGADEKTVTVQAPVSRDTRSAATGRLQSSRVELTSDERKLAATMGISEIAYARGKLQLEAAKRADPEKYGRVR